MPKARYYKSDGKKGRARELPESIFDGVVNEGVLHQAVKAYRANQRQGTGSAKNRSAVRGGSRKPWRQKGTGRARHGTIRSPIWEGGGVAFPPIPHSWRQKLPKKLKSLARRSALNSRAEDDRVILIDGLEFDEPRTRRLVEYLEGIEVGGKVLLLTHGLKKNVYLSGRNVQGLRIMPFGQETAYDVLLAHTVVIERSALEESAAEEVEEASASEPEPSVQEAASSEEVAGEADEASPEQETEATAEKSDEEASEPEAEELAGGEAAVALEGASEEELVAAAPTPEEESSDGGSETEEEDKEKDDA